MTIFLHRIHFEQHRDLHVICVQSICCKERIFLSSSHLAQSVFYRQVSSLTEWSLVHRPHLSNQVVHIHVVNNAHYKRPFIKSPNTSSTPRPRFILLTDFKAFRMLLRTHTPTIRGPISVLCSICTLKLLFFLGRYIFVKSGEDQSPPSRFQIR